MDLEKILSGIPNEGDPAIKEEEQVETPAEPKTEKEEAVDTTPTQEGDKPVETPAAETPEETAKTPVEPAPSARESYRWAQMRQELKEEKEARQAYEERLAQIESSVTKSKAEEKVEIPNEFVALFGDNPEAWQQFSALTEKQAQKIVGSRIDAMEQKRSEASKAEERYQQAIQEEFRLLGEDVGKDLSDPENPERNAILKFALENPIINPQGNIDLQKVYSLYQRLNPPKVPSEERKKIAAVTTDGAPRTEEMKPVRFGQARNFNLDTIFNE